MYVCKLSGVKKKKTKHFHPRPQSRYLLGVVFHPLPVFLLDCKTVVSFAKASDGQYSNESSEGSVRTPSELFESRGLLAAFLRRALRATSHTSIAAEAQISERGSLP